VLLLTFDLLFSLLCFFPDGMSQAAKLATLIDANAVHSVLITTINFTILNYTNAVGLITKITENH
jgi:hypothetical protein